MKKLTLIVTVILLIACLFSSCAKTVKLEPRQDGYYNEKLKVYYSIAPSCYEAVGYIKEAYAVDTHDFNYHIVTDPSGNKANAADWLYDAENSALLYNSDNKLPTLAEMKPIGVDFFAEGANRINLFSATEAAEITAIMACLENPYCGRSSVRSDINDSYGLRFTSAAYPFIVYVLDYIEFSQNIYEYEKADGYTDAADVEARYEFRDGVEHEIVAEDDGSYTVKYNYGKYFIYDENAGRYYMAAYIHDNYNSGEKN